MSVGRPSIMLKRLPYLSEHFDLAVDYLLLTVMV